MVLLAAFCAWEARIDHPMVELSLFRSPAFTAAAGAIMVLFFGLAGMTFVLTQIYQFVLGYSPLAAGVRALPAALALAVAAPVGTRLAAHFGIRATVTGGLVTMAAGLGFFGLATAGSGYSHYLVASVAMTAGVGLTMAPATQSIMATLPPAKTGVGSAIGNVTRNLGTVLGVAVVGSIAATLYRQHMATTSGAPAPARQSIGAAAQVVGRLSDAHADAAARALHTTSAGAFVHGATVGVLVAAAIAVVTAAVVARYLPPRTGS
jgi:hypothetical protein